MASDRVVNLWQEALRQLEALPTEEAGESGPAAASSAHLFPLPSLNEFQGVEQFSLSVWRRLVNDFKVPLKLGEAAASAGGPWAPKGCAALSALAKLMGQAAAPGAPDSITRTIGQQLQRSGFMAALPRLLDAAAAALTATQQQPDLASVPQDITHISSGPALAPAAWRVLSLQAGTTWLLQLLALSQGKWPQVVDQAAVALPALRLCAAAMQHCSCCVDTLPADAPAPTALEALMRAAFIAGHAVVCSAMQEQPGLDLSVLQSPDAMSTVCMLLMVLVLSPQQFHQETLTLSMDPDAAKHRMNLTQGCGSPDVVSTSLSAWKYACAHSSNVSQLQQKVLRELGCSSRAFMFVAGHALAPFVSSCTVLMLGSMYQQMVQSSPPPLQLEQPEQVQQLAESLSKLDSSCRAGQTPPGGSPMLPCAALLWLVPAVLLEWAGRQAAGGPDFARHHQAFSALLWLSAEHVLEQQQFWDLAETAFINAAGQQRDEHEELLNVVRSWFPGTPIGFGAPYTVESLAMRNLRNEQSRQVAARKQLFQRASTAAVELGSCWELPAVSLAQLLHVASSAAARILARMQEARAVPVAAGTSNDGSGSSTRGNSAASSSSNSADVPQGDTQSLLSEALLRLSQAVEPLLHMSNLLLWKATHKADLARRRPLLSGVQAASSCHSGDSSPGDSSLTDNEQAGLVSLCTTLQQNLPQLASMVEAAVRTGVGSKPGGAHELIAIGCMFLHWLTSPALFVAAGLTQCGSPALKPLCSLSMTLLKLLNTSLSNPSFGKEGVHDHCVSLWGVMSFTSLILQATCASSSAAGSGSDGSGTSSMASGSAGESSSSTRANDSASTGGSLGGSSMGSSEGAILGMLLQSNASMNADSWDVPSLSSLSRTAVVRGAAASQNSGSGSSSTSHAVALVPWLVTLGRCCLGYALDLQHADSSTLPAEGLGSLSDLGLAFAEAAPALSKWMQSSMQGSSVSAQLAAAGYSTGRVLELLESATQTHRQAQQANAAVLAQGLQELGLALCSMPVGTACNNPRCSVLAGVSELQLVVGTARLCGGCRVARYCCRACQAAHWKQHKPACKAIAAAVVAARDPGPA